MVRLSWSALRGLTFFFTAPGSSSTTLAAPFPWAPWAVASGMASRAPETLPESVFLSFFLSFTHLPPGRTPHWRRLLHQSQSPRDRRKLWRLGWHVLNFRLCNQGLAAERGCLECHSFGVYDRWLFGCTKSVIRHPLFILPLTHFFFSGGPKSALGSAIACGILLGVFEGVGVLVSRVFSEGNRPQMAPRMFAIYSFL